MRTLVGAALLLVGVWLGYQALDGMSSDAAAANLADSFGMDGRAMREETKHKRGVLVGGAAACAALGVMLIDLTGRKN